MRAARSRCGTWDPSGASSRHPKHQGAVLAEGWHPGGNILATAGEDGVGRVWDVGSGEEHVVVPVGDGKGWVEHLAWESGGERLAMTAGKTLQVLKWSESGGCFVEWETSDHKSSVSDLRWRTGYPGQIFSSCFGGVTLWQVGMDSPVNTFPYEGALLSLSISSNGQYLASGNLDGRSIYGVSQPGRTGIWPVIPARSGTWSSIPMENLYGQQPVLIW